MTQKVKDALEKAKKPQKSTRQRTQEEIQKNNSNWNKPMPWPEDYFGLQLNGRSSMLDDNLGGGKKWNGAQYRG